MPGSLEIPQTVAAAEAIAHFKSRVAAEDVVFSSQYDAFAIATKSHANVQKAWHRMEGNEFLAMSSLRGSSPPFYVTPLGSHILLQSSLKEAAAHPGVAPTLHRFAGTQLMKLAGFSAQKPAGLLRPPTRRLESYVGCPNTESFLSGALDILEATSGVAAKHQTTLSVYHDNGTPLAFRKSETESTAITLAPLQVADDLVLPAGWLIGVDGSEMPKTGKHFDHHYLDIGNKHKTTALQAFSVEEGMKGLPLRALPWAYPEAVDRSLYAIRYFEELDRQHITYDAARGDIVVNRSLDDFQAAARRIIDLCA
jgi:hypothetical protein